MKAVVLGAGGQVGRALMAAAPAGTVGLDRARCDITDAAAVAQCVAGADLVINAAAYTDVERAEAEPDATMRLNADGPRLIADACAAAGARLVHISTDFVFDGRQGQPYRIDDLPDPLNAYGRSKLAGEQAVAAALPEALIVRTAWVYSASGRNFLTGMMRQMRTHGRVEVVDDQVGTPTWAPDLARALWTLAERGAAGLHHWTDAGVASRYDFALAIAEEAIAAGLMQDAPAMVAIASADRPSAARRPAWSVLDKHPTWAAHGAPAAHWRPNLRRCLKEMAGG